MAMGQQCSSGVLLHDFSPASTFPSSNEGDSRTRGIQHARMGLLGVIQLSDSHWLMGASFRGVVHSSTGQTGRTLD